MTTEDGESPRRDRVIDNRAFQMGGGVNLDAFLDSDAMAKVAAPASAGASPTDRTLPLPEQSTDDVDEALGDILDPFAETGPRPGDILRDGTVYGTPETDSVTDMAQQVEHRLHWGMLVLMIFTYSVIGWLVATSLPPMFAAAGLIGLAVLGLVLGEFWVPNPRMHMLGVTWVIISMKLLYGFAIDVHHWGWVPDAGLGGLLLALVGLNVFVAYRHDHDAIAAQATLVLLAIASATGMVGGEAGVAAMILAATGLLHGLALHRGSGNLAALGIAASHLWVGLHAIQSEPLALCALTIVPLSSPLLLFLTMFAVTAVNGAMAARFAREANWFSQGLSAMGLGKPGLWGVSIGLGMIGALLLLVAERDATGFALGLLITLLSVYGGSYLVVRGVAATKVIRPLAIAAPIVLALLLIPESFSLGWLPLSGYELYTIGATIATAQLLLRHQSNVTDRVLWTGSLVIMTLLTILVPAHTPASGGDAGLLLLSCLLILHLATAGLALMRQSPSLAGVTVLAPWAWMLVHRMWTASAGTYAAAREVEVGAIDAVYLDPLFITIYLGAVTLLQLPLNLRLGETGVNVASALVGSTELSARLRDSGMMRLWNLGFLAGIGVWLLIATPENLGDTGWGAMVGLMLLGLVHFGAECMGKHQGNPRTLLIVFALAMLILQWRGGADAVWLVLLIAAVLPLSILGREPKEGSAITIGMLLGALIITMFALDRFVHILWFDGDELSRASTAWVMLLGTGALLGIYLPRSAGYEQLLKPAAAALALLGATIYATWHDDLPFIQLGIALVMFFGSGLWLAAQGAIRAEVKGSSRREARIEEVARRQALMQAVSTGELPSMSAARTLPAGELPVAAAPAEAPGKVYHFADDALASQAANSDPAMAKRLSSAVSTGPVKMVDPKLLELREKQQRRRRKAGAHGDEAADLLYGDIHHRPVVVLAFIGVTILAAAYLSWMNSFATAGFLLGAAVFSMALTFISRWRASVNNLRLPDIGGVELPFGVTIIGLWLIYLAGHLGVGNDLWMQLDLIVLCFGISALAGIGLLGRDDLAWRIPSAVEWVIGSLALLRLGGALFGEALPFPLTVDPFDAQGSLIGWTLPWFFHELTVLVAVLVWDWIEGYRRKNGMPDHRGAAGRATFALMVAIISMGPATLVATALCLRRSIQWKQPAAVAMCAHTGLIGAYATIIAARSFIATDTMVDLLQWTTFGIAALMVGLQLASTFTARPRWTTAWMWNAHLLLPFAVLLLTGLGPWMIIAFFTLSLTTWVSGIIELRKGLRVMGGADLALALLGFILIFQQGALNPMMLLPVFIALAIELGIVTWLWQRRSEEITDD